MLPLVPLTKGIHVLHLFYRIDRLRWTQLPAGHSALALAKLEALCAANAAPSHPRLTPYVNIGGKADLVFILTTAELGGLGQLHRDLEDCFSPATIQRMFSYLSVTELPEYMTTEEDMKQTLIRQEQLQPDSEPFVKRLAEMRQRQSEYEHYRLYPEMPDWEVMAFYPMSKRRNGADNCRV